jgi:hypothetical protein
MKLGTGLLLWYGIFCFVTGQINPMEWSTIAKILAILVGFALINASEKY